MHSRQACEQGPAFFFCETLPCCCNSSHQWILTVTGTECMTVPDVPVTITVAAELALIWRLLFPPEHPTAISAVSSTAPSARVRSFPLVQKRRRVSPARSRPAKPNGNTAAMTIGE